MATQKSKSTGTAASRPGASSRAASARKTGKASLDRLNASLEAAQNALVDLQSNLGRSGRNRLSEVQKMVRNALRDTRKLNRSLRSDIEQIQEAIVSGRRPARRAASRGASSKSTATRRSGARRSGAKRTGAKRTGASGAKKSS